MVNKDRLYRLYQAGTDRFGRGTNQLLNKLNWTAINSSLLTYVSFGKFKLCLVTCHNAVLECFSIFILSSSSYSFNKKLTCATKYNGT